MKKGFTLIEMLVVIGIIAVLVAASIGGYSAVTKNAEKATCQELCSNVASALAVLYQREGEWPKILAVRGATDGRLDEQVAKALKGYLTLTFDDEGALAGYDRFGIVSPWATAKIKAKGLATTSSDVSDHVLHFAVDDDGDGIIRGASVGGETIDVRATAIVWCAGKDGKMEPYTKGLRSDDVYSWTKGQTVK